MTQELFYTSAPKGLRSGTSGFCTVAATRNVSELLMEKLEALSFYRHMFPSLDPRNPVAFAHARLVVLGKEYHVVSRIGPAGLNYTQRSNMFAHHVVLEDDELARGGPAWLLGQPGFMERSWEGAPGHLSAGRKPPMGDVRLEACRRWQEVTGDAGWAGVLAERTVTNPSQPIYVVFPLGIDLLSLFEEAQILLPPERRWEVTFSTYFTVLPQGTTCNWRGVPLGSPEAETLLRQHGVSLLNLSVPLGQAEGAALVEQARTGQIQLPSPDADLGDDAWANDLEPLPELASPAPSFEEASPSTYVREHFDRPATRRPPPATSGHNRRAVGARMPPPPPPPDSAHQDSFQPRSRTVLPFSLGLGTAIVAATFLVVILWSLDTISFRHRSDQSKDLPSERQSGSHASGLIESINKDKELAERETKLASREKEQGQREQKLNARIIVFEFQRLGRGVQAKLQSLKKTAEVFTNARAVKTPSPTEKTPDQRAQVSGLPEQRLFKATDISTVYDQPSPVEPKGGYLDPSRNYQLGLVGLHDLEKYKKTILNLEVQDTGNLCIRHNGKAVLEFKRNGSQLAYQWQKDATSDLRKSIQNHTILEIVDVRKNGDRAARFEDNVFKDYISLTKPVSPVGPREFTLSGGTWRYPLRELDAILWEGFELYLDAAALGSKDNPEKKLAGDATTKALEFEAFQLRLGFEDKGPGLSKNFFLELLPKREHKGAMPLLQSVLV